MLIYMHLEMGYILAYNLMVFMYLCVRASFRGFSCCVLSPHSYFEVSLSFYNVFYTQIYFCEFILYKYVFIRTLVNCILCLSERDHVCFFRSWSAGGSKAEKVFHQLFTF